MAMGGFGRMLARDSLLVALAIAGWWAGADLSADLGPVADVVGVVLGLGAGAVAYVGHEWGHLVGALATGAVVTPPERWTSRYLFSFDSRVNGRAQFLVMSFSGFAVTGLAIWVTYGLLPDDLLATRVARGSVVFLTSLTVLIELPLVGWSLLARSLPPVEVFPGRSPST